MPERNLYAAYIMASRSRTLYIGMTGHLKRRVLEHKCRLHPGFASRYHCDRLVWFENFEYVGNAIAMEKKLKGWLRARKVALIESRNPTWEDLSADWYSREQLENFGTEKQILRFAQNDNHSMDANLDEKA
jgi:putative endonuclease